MLDLSDTLKLTGIAYVQGKPVATLVNKTTKQTYLVTSEPNALGWKLAGVSTGSHISHAEVKIMVGGEIVSIRYSETQLAPAKRGLHALEDSNPRGIHGARREGSLRAGYGLSDRRGPRSLPKLDFQGRSG